MAPQAVVFDMDGVIVDSEILWHEVRREFVQAYGGRWSEDDQRAVMGANSRQWAEYIKLNFGAPLELDEIIAAVIRLLEERLDAHLPLLPGAVKAVRTMAEVYPLAIASSSPTAIIDYVLRAADLEGSVRARVSSDEVDRGKPAPDVYLEACARLAVKPANSCAVEDSANGIRAADAAGLAVIAIPNRQFPPPEEALQLARVVLRRVADLTPEIVSQLD